MSVLLIKSPNFDFYSNSYSLMKSLIIECPYKYRISDELKTKSINTLGSSWDPGLGSGVRVEVSGRGHGSRLRLGPELTSDCSS